MAQHPNSSFNMRTTMGGGAANVISVNGIHPGRRSGPSIPDVYSRVTLANEENYNSVRFGSSGANVIPAREVRTNPNYAGGSANAIPARTNPHYEGGAANVVSVNEVRPGRHGGLFIPDVYSKATLVNEEDYNSVRFGSSSANVIPARQVRMNPHHGSGSANVIPAPQVRKNPHGGGFVPEGNSKLTLADEDLSGTGGPPVQPAGRNATVGDGKHTASGQREKRLGFGFSKK